MTRGLNDIRKGLAILADTVGTHSPRYLAAEIAYARVLDSSGEHSESAAIKSTVATELSVLCGECGLYRKRLVGLLTGR